jgi:hypothetical protein
MDAAAHEPTTESRWRLELGRHVGLAFARNPLVAAVLVAGSVARGHADRYSDIELFVCWVSAPPDPDREAVVAPLTGDYRLLPFDAAWQCWEDELFIGRSALDAPKTGVIVEVVHQLVPVVDEVVSDVVDRYDPDLDKQSTVHALLHGVPVAGEQLLRSWATRAEPYPRELAVAMVKTYAQVDFFDNWRRFLARGENFMLIDDWFSQIERRMLLVLQALNGRYHYKFKWLDRVIDELEISPPQLAERLRAIGLSQTPEAAEILRELVEDVYGLVERHLPEVDVARLRTIFRWHRPEWDSPPPVMLPRLD